MVMAMAVQKFAVVLLLVGVSAATLTTEEIIQNGFSTDLEMHCTSLNSDYGRQSLKPGEIKDFTITSSLGDPSVNCQFSSVGQDQQPAISKTLEVWNYAKSGYSDSPWLACNPSCNWKLDSNGAFYRTQGGDYEIFSTWG